MARGAKRASVEAGPLEKPWELPDGWRWERLQDVVEINPKTDLGAVGDEPVTFLGMAAVSEENGHVDVSVVRPASQVAKGYTRFQSEDVLFAKITPCMENGKVAVVPELASGIGAGSTEFHVIRCDKLLPKLLFHFLVQRGVRQDARRNMTGTAGQMRVSTDYLRLLPVPVPPPDTQRALVARIDELFAEIDDGSQALETAKEGVDVYRKALLNSAVTGRLTADWRRRNSTLATDGDLLGRLLGERQARWEADPKNRSKTYKSPPGPVATALDVLPDGWIWASVGQLIDGIEAGLNVKALGRPPSGAEFGIVKISAVTWDVFNESESKALPPSQTIDPAHLIRPGDFLFSRANTLELVGAPAIVENLNRRLVLSDKVLRLRMPDQLKKWLYFVLKSPFGRRQIEGRSTGNQLSMRNIPQAELRDIPVPLPPLEELTFASDLVQKSWDANAHLGTFLGSEDHPSALRQSILAAAFRGDLVA